MFDFLTFLKYLLCVIVVVAAVAAVIVFVGVVLGVHGSGMDTAGVTMSLEVVSDYSNDIRRDRQTLLIVLLYLLILKYCTNVEEHI